MPLNNRGLGRGIQALFESGQAEQAASHGDSPLRLVPIDSVIPNPDQPRKTFPDASLNELAASISVHGVLQPLLVRSRPDGSWQLIAGERRLRAAKIAGQKQVPILIRNLSDQDMLIVALLENLQREDLNPIEEAQGLDALKRAANVGVEDLADMLGQPRSTISNTLRLLTLAAGIQTEVANRRLSLSHAKILAGLPQEAGLALLARIQETGMTIRQTEEAVTFWRENGRFPWETINTGAQVMPVKRPNPDLLHLEANISSVLNCRVKISGSESRGKITLAYGTSGELAQILSRLGLADGESSPGGDK